MRVNGRGGLGLMLAVFLGTQATAAELRWPALQKSAAQQYPGCPGTGRGAAPVRALDMSQPVTAAMLAAARRQGIQTIFRYYDWEDPGGELTANQCGFMRRTGFNRGFDFAWPPGPTFRGKMLSAEERDLILSRGFSIGIVFQHCNQYPATFLDGQRGAFDGRRALAMAKELGQPKGTTIFFTVDVDVADDAVQAVDRYFRAVNGVVPKAGYRVGVYGNGFICERLHRKGLAAPCWLSQSTGHRGSLGFEREGDWSIKQCATREPLEGSAAAFDPDIIAAKGGALRLWQPR